VRANFSKTFAFSKGKVYSLSNPTDQIRIRNKDPLGHWRVHNPRVVKQHWWSSASPMYLLSFPLSYGVRSSTWGSSPHHSMRLDPIASPLVVAGTVWWGCQPLPSAAEKEKSTSKSKSRQVIAVEMIATWELRNLWRNHAEWRDSFSVWLGFLFSFCFWRNSLSNKKWNGMARICKYDYSLNLFIVWKHIYYQISNMKLLAWLTLWKN
jgi:hypothetical protein